MEMIFETLFARDLADGIRKELNPSLKLDFGLENCAKFAKEEPQLRREDLNKGKEILAQAVISNKPSSLIKFSFWYYRYTNSHP
jgi:hypothetical protein